MKKSCSTHGFLQMIAENADFYQELQKNIEILSKDHKKPAILLKDCEKHAMSAGKAHAMRKLHPGQS